MVNFEKSSSQVQEIVGRILKDTTPVQHQNSHLAASSSIEARQKLIDALRNRDIPILSCGGGSACGPGLGE